MKVLITEGAGFIAYHLATALPRNNEEVILNEGIRLFAEWFKGKRQNGA
jgi:nucleoside-diphosphate-sugar epimerase